MVGRRGRGIAILRCWVGGLRLEPSGSPRLILRTAWLGLSAAFKAFADGCFLLEAVCASAAFEAFADGFLLEAVCASDALRRFLMAASCWKLTAQWTRGLQLRSFCDLPLSR
jgi:hypothetical protein